MTDLDRDILPARGEVAALIRQKDWSRTLGPLADWPLSLRTVLGLMLSSRYAMWLGWGPDLRFFYNDAYRAQTLGNKHPAALGEPARDVWVEIADAIGPRVEHVLATGEATWDEGLLLLLERSGFAEETYHTFSYSPAFDDGGQIRGLFCVVIEETDRVVGERRTAIQRDLAAALSRTSSTAEVLAATATCFGAASSSIPFSLSYLLDDASLGRLVSKTGFGEGHPSIPTTLDPAEHDPLFAINEVHRTGTPREVRLSPAEVWPSGHWKVQPEKAYVVPIPQAGRDEPAGIVVFGVNPHRPLDDTYRSFLELVVGQLATGLDNARAYEDAQRRAEALAQVDRAKTAFFSNVSHEFRTPLTLMLGPTEDALASPERALRGGALEVVHRNELRLLKLVNALLDFSRIEAGRFEASYEPTDLAALTNDLASAFRSAMERGGLAYSVECEALDEPFYVDRDMWEKIVLNLLSNALKFTLEGKVAISLRREGTGVVLRVEDTGPGIAPEELPRTFERFHRVEGTPARTHEGSGIGLALVHDLVALHGGDIRVSSEVGSGTCFSVTVPSGRSHLPPERVRPGEAELRPLARADSFLGEALRWLPGGDDGAGSTSPDGVEAGRATLLVADDNADMRSYLTRLLRERWNVKAVSDGEAALEVIRAAPPDLVLADVMMPRMDGFALLGAIRGAAPTRTLPVILLSARAGDEATSEGLRAGANDYLTKPFSARELLVRVASQLTIAKVRSEVDTEKETQRRVVHSLFQSAPAGIALIRGEEQIIDFANPMALDIWGKDATVIGKPVLEALPELRGKGFDDLMREVVRSGVPFVGEDVPVVLRRASRLETVYLKFVYAPVLDERGVGTGVAAFGFDVTKQVLSRQRAVLGAAIGRVFVSDKELTEQLRRCCEALVDFGAAFARIWTLNEDRGALELRASAGMYTHVDGAHALIPLGKLKIGRIAVERQPHLTNTVVGDPQISDQEWARREKITAFAGYPLTVGERLVGVLALFSKETLSPEVVETLASVADQIALGVERDRADRFRELFIGMLGHDLRNPLNAVNMAAHMLQSSPLTPRQSSNVARIRNSASRMSRMITQVLDFTRARSGGGIPIARTPTDLRAVCDEVVEELVSANPQCVIQVDHRGDTSGQWDADRFAQVFSNLLGNAITYGEPGKPVRLVIDGSGSRVRSAVTNHGPAIPPELLASLFDPFRRAAHGKRSGTSGLGLGLFIAQEIVVAHGGRIDVRSTENEITFSFDVPRREEYEI